MKKGLWNCCFLSSISALIYFFKRMSANCHKSGLCRGFTWCCLLAGLLQTGSLVTCPALGRRWRPHDRGKQWEKNKQIHWFLSARMETEESRVCSEGDLKQKLCYDKHLLVCLSEGEHDSSNPARARVRMWVLVLPWEMVFKIQNSFLQPRQTMNISESTLILTVLGFSIWETHSLGRDKHVAQFEK